MFQSTFLVCVFTTIGGAHEISFCQVKKVPEKYIYSSLHGESRLLCTWFMVITSFNSSQSRKL